MREREEKYNKSERVINVITFPRFVRYDLGSLIHSQKYMYEDELVTTWEAWEWRWEN